MVAVAEYVGAKMEEVGYDDGGKTDAVESCTTGDDDSSSRVDEGAADDVTATAEEEEKEKGDKENGIGGVFATASYAIGSSDVSSSNVCGAGQTGGGCGDDVREPSHSVFRQPAWLTSFKNKLQGLRPPQPSPSASSSFTGRLAADEKSGIIQSLITDDTSSSTSSSAIGMDRLHLPNGLLSQKVRENEWVRIGLVGVVAIIAMVFMFKLAGIFKKKTTKTAAGARNAKGGGGGGGPKKVSTKYPLKDRQIQLQQQQHAQQHQQPSGNGRERDGYMHSNSSNSRSSTNQSSSSSSLRQGANKFAINPPPPSHSVGPGGKAATTKRRTSVTTGTSPVSRRNGNKRDSPSSDDGSVASMSTIGNSSNHLRYTEGFAGNLDAVQRGCDQTPDVLVGHRLDIDTKGECTVLAVVRKLGRRTQFQIRLRDGSTEKVRLARKRRDKSRSDELAFTVIA